jgi:hypothetical protein
MKEHVELLVKIVQINGQMNEFDLTKTNAEKRLRDSEGNVKDALLTCLYA